MADDREGPRVSLLDVVRESLHRLGKTTVLSRVIVCAEFADSESRPDIGSYYQKFFKQHQGESELITGALLVFPTSCVHVVEASSKLVLSFLRDLSGNGKSEVAGLLKNSKLILSSDDISSRIFPFWASRTLDTSSLPPLIVEEEKFMGESLANSLIEIGVNLVNLGKTLSGLQKTEVKAALDQLLERFADMIPREEVIKVICANSSVTSVQEYLEIADGEVQLTLDSELVWPLFPSIYA